MATPPIEASKVLRTTDVTTTSDFRQNLRERLDQVKDTGRPLFVTTNGQTEAVVVSAKLFNALVDKAELADSVASLRRGMEDVKAGRVRDFRTAIHDIAKELGVTLNT